MSDKPNIEHRSGNPINEDWLLRQLCAVDKKDFNSVGNGLQKATCESNGHPNSVKIAYEPWSNRTLMLCRTCGVHYQRKPTEKERRDYREGLGIVGGW